MEAVQNYVAVRLQTQLRPDPKLAPKQSHRDRLNILMLQVRHPNVSPRGSGPIGTGCFNGLALPSETGHLPRREEGLPTFTLEKLVPGGIAEVRPQDGRAGEGQGAPGSGRGTNPRAGSAGLWLLLEFIVIMKAGVIPFRPYPLEI